MQWCLMSRKTKPIQHCFTALTMAQIPVPGMNWDMVVLLKNNVLNANPVSQ
jgi:hypothetical protein